MELLLDSAYYLYNYYMVCALFSHAHHVTHLTCDCDIVMWYFSTLLPCVVSPNKKRKEKERKRNINNDLAILPSHDTMCYEHWVGLQLLSAMVW